MSTPSTSTPLTLERMREDIARILHESPDEVGLDDNLMDWGLDSLRLMNLVTRWNETGLQLDISELASQITLNGMWQVVSQRQGRA